VGGVVGDDLGLDFLGDHGEKLLSDFSYTLQSGLWGGKDAALAA
jgi:hypothetical protein